MDTKFDFTVIPKLEEGEKLLFHVDVGNLPPKKAMEYLESVRTIFKESVLTDNENNHYIFAPMYNGKKTVEIEKVKDNIK